MVLSGGPDKGEAVNSIKTYDIDTDHRRHNQYTPLSRKKKKNAKKENNKKRKDKKKGNKSGKLDIEI